MSLCSESRPEHCYDWITPDEAVRMAVQAFAVARSQCRQPVGERFIEEGARWSMREAFACDLGTVFQLQVNALAYRLGVAGDQFEADAVRLAKWGVEPSPAPVRRSGRAVAR
jgi:hypothetical protein